METKSYTTIDRAAEKWPSGDWDGEPDKVQWPDAKTGLPCLAVRHSTSGHWCGYVGIAEGHPYFGLGYNEVYEKDDSIAAHGGLTFASACQPREAESEGICHVPAVGEPDHVWWFGFDCAHSGDASPRDAMYERDRGGEYPFARGDWETYKTLAYVQAECGNLARQLAAIPVSDAATSTESASNPAKNSVS